MKDSELNKIAETILKDGPEKLKQIMRDSPETYKVVVAYRDSFVKRKVVELLTDVLEVIDSNTEAALESLVNAAGLCSELNLDSRGRKLFTERGYRIVKDNEERETNV